MAIPADFFDKNTRIPSPPAIAMRLLETLRKDEFSFGEIAKIIQSDPALTAKVLKVVNSPFYSIPRKVSSIELALSIMGMKAVKNIALSFILIDGLKSKSAGDFDFNVFWKRSITAAVGAELIAAQLKTKNDDTFVTALLQDIGSLMLYYSRPEEYLKLLTKRTAEQIPAEILEDQAFGFNHQDVGSEILHLWGLSENISMPIRYHHTPEEAPEPFRNQAKILFLADRAAALYNDTQSFGTIREAKEMFRESLAINNSAFTPFLDKVACKSIEILSSFEIPPGEIKPFSQLLQDANEGLSNLNLSYEKLLAELEEQKLEAERLAQELKEANHKLRELSVRDVLTGLYNRRFLYDFLTIEMGRSQRNGKIFSFVLFDIDHFKKVNDTFGHNAGDQLLKAVSKKLLELKRQSDMVARYGGEEFAVVLAETEIEDGKLFAERCRKAIEDMGIIIAGQTVQVTISAGVSVFDPRQAEMTTIDNLAEVADKALYHAKTTGRNKVVSAYP